VRFHPSIAFQTATAHGGETPLHLAARWGDDSKAIELIQAGADLTAVDDEGGTPLHAAVNGGHASTVQLLLASGADPCRLLGKWPENTPLQKAATKGDTVVAGMLINALKKAGVGLETTNRSGETALRAAASWGRTDTVLLLLSMGASASAVDQHGQTALHMAASHGNVEMVQALLDAGAETARAGADTIPLAAAARNPAVAAQLSKVASVDVVDGLGRTPLHLAVTAGHAAVVSVLLDAGASINIPIRTMMNSTALHLAARHKRATTLQVLINAGADMSARDYMDCTPLHTAVDNGCSACLTLLLAAHAPSNVGDRNMQTPMHLAVSAGNVAAVEQLAAAGADLNAVDGRGATPLIQAVRLGIAGMVRVLLMAGAQPHVAAAQGWTALHHAADRGDSEAVELLIAQGAFVNATLDTRDTPLHLAVKGKHTATVQVLLAAGAEVYIPGSSSRSALCMAAAIGHMPTVECLLQHRWLGAAAAADDMVKSAAAAAQATSLDASTKQGVVLHLLLPAVKSNTVAAKAALKQCMEPAGNTVSSVLIDAWLESAAVVADIDKQRTAVQHLIISMAAAHKQQQGELRGARLTLKSEKQHSLKELLVVERAVLNQQRESLSGWGSAHIWPSSSSS
jgi:ankyrin repeat protein